MMLTRLTRLMTAFAAALVAAAMIAAACASGDSQPQPSAAQSQQPESYQAGDPQSVQDAQPDEQARVQVLRGRASLGSPDAPIVITEYSDFL